MRIGLIIPSYYPRWGGAENQARRQVREFVKRGHEVEIVTWKRDPSLPDHSFLDGANVHRVARWQSGPHATVRALIRMAWLLLDVARRADVLAAHHLLSTAYMAGFAAEFTGTPIVSLAAAGVTQERTDLTVMSGTGASARLRRLLALPLRRGVAVALSSWIADDLRQLGFRRIVRIPNGIEDAGIPDRARLRADLYHPLCIPEHAKIVLAAGRLVHQKGFDVLIRAWPQVRARQNDAELVIVGSGPEDATLRACALASGVSQSVHFVPESSRTQDYIGGADVVVIPSRFEGLANFLLETMAAGKPLVATRVSGTVDLIVDGINGRLIDIDDPVALADALSDVLRNPGEMGRRARETVLAECEIQHVIDLYLQLFLTVCGDLHHAQSPAPDTLCVESAE